MISFLNMSLTLFNIKHAWLQQHVFIRLPKQEWLTIYVMKYAKINKMFLYKQAT